MKLKPEFVTQQIDDTQFLIAMGGAGFSGLARSNRTAAFIVDCLREETTEAAIIRKLLEKYDVSEERAGADVRAIIEKLRGIGAIVE